MANGATKSTTSTLLKGTSLSTRGVVLASALALAAGLSSAAFAEVEFTPTAELSVTHTDNVFLTPTGEEDDTVFSADLALELSATTARLRSALYYQLAYDKYDTADQFDGLRHALRATNSFEVSPDFFYVDLNGSIQERSRDRNNVRAATERTYGGEQLRVSTVSLRPYIKTLIGSQLELLASVELASVTYSDTDVGGATVLPDDVTRTTEQFKIGTESSRNHFTWSLEATGRQLDNDRDSTNVLGSAFYDISGTMRLIGRVGYDKADTNGDGTDNIDETSWRAGFEMRPSLRSFFRFESGQRYGRTTYDVAAGHTFRDSFALDASYRHTLVTDAGQFIDVSATPVFDDTGTLIGFDDITADIVNDSYISRRAQVNVSGKLQSLSYRVGLGYQDREFDFSPNNETIYRVTARLDYLLTERFKVFGSAGVSNEDADIPAQETDIERYALGGAFALTPTAQLSLQGVSQSYEYGTGVEVTENAVVLSISKSW